MAEVVLFHMFCVYLLHVAVLVLRFANLASEFWDTCCLGDTHSFYFVSFSELSCLWLMRQGDMVAEEQDTTTRMVVEGTKGALGAWRIFMCIFCVWLA